MKRLDILVGKHSRRLEFTSIPLLARARCWTLVGNSLVLYGGWHCINGILGVRRDILVYCALQDAYVAE